MGKKISDPAPSKPISSKPQVSHLNDLLRDEALFTCLRAEKPHAKKLIQRLFRKRWFFCVQYQEGDYLVTIGKAIDVEKDLRAKLKGVQFTVE